MTDKRVECPVLIAPDVAVGEYANAFRVVHDTGKDWFLDFLAFSESEQTAKVVSRIRVAEDFMDSIRRRLDATMVYIREERAKTDPDESPGPPN